MGLILFASFAGPVILPGSDAGNNTLIGINSYLLTNATGDVLCGDPSLGEVATSVGAYSAFLKATLREFEGLSNVPQIHQSVIVLSNDVPCEQSIKAFACCSSECTFDHYTNKQEGLSTGIAICHVQQDAWCAAQDPDFLR